MRRIMVYFCILSLLLFPLACGGGGGGGDSGGNTGAGSPSQRNTVKGTVTQAGGPAVAVSVVAKDALGLTLGSGTTNALGQYSFTIPGFDNLPATVKMYFGAAPAPTDLTVDRNAWTYTVDKAL